MNRKTAVFAAGCFWGVEDAFMKVEGVISTKVGYTGGDTEDPTYEDVCTDRTGHAEAIFIVYDADVISYEKLLKVFWSIHDPTQLNKQGPDVGSQYRSAIFFFSQEQKRLAEEDKNRFNNKGIYRRPVVTEISPAAEFWDAEEYHQKYCEKSGRCSCQTHRNPLE